MFNIFLTVFFATLAFAFFEPYFFIGYLISIALFGLYQAIFMANAGGAWDNAKKIVEVELKQKGTPLHAATVVGDTVGDPFKDTSSVALNPIIKFTTLFGLLAVELAVSLTEQRGPGVESRARGGVLRGLDVLRVPLVLRDADRGGSGVASRVPWPQSARARRRSRLPFPRPAASRAISCSSSTTGCALTRTLEERLVALYRQTKVVGGLFRSLGQEADAVGSRVRARRRAATSSRRSSATSARCWSRARRPLEVLRQYMAKGDSPTRGRELNIHFGDIERGFIGQISPPGRHGAGHGRRHALLQDAQREPRVGLVYVGDGATSTGAFHEGINFAAVQRCPLVVIVENNGYAYSTPTAQADRGHELRRQGRGLRRSRATGPTATMCSRSTR